MAGAAAPVQVGIFTNDLCIGFRIIVHELLDTHVYRVFDAAKEIQKQRPQDSFRAMYERGMKSINAWDTQLKERYRAQVIAQYRQLTDLYHHIYLMYVQEMYDQSLDDVTVRVNIPALSTMLHMFLRLACNHHVILSGEYVTNMAFSGRVLFVETIIRRLLYELLVQQNNIKSISTARRAGGAPGARANISVHSEEDMLSADMMMGTQRQPAPRLSPTGADADRFWMAPNSPTGSQLSNVSSDQLSNLSGQAVMGPGYQPRTSPTRASPLANLIPVRTGSPLRNSPDRFSAENNSAEQVRLNPVNASPVGSPQNSALNIGQGSAGAGSTGNGSTHGSGLMATFVSPIPLQGSELSVSQAVAPASQDDTVLTGAPGAAPAPFIPNDIPRITSLPNHPIISGSVAGSEKSPDEPLFELKSQFTPFKPGGTAYPEAIVPGENRKDLEVDSLQLQPSDQDFAEEARRLLQDNTSDTVTPFDSVTNIANGDRRPPLFFDPVRAP